MSVEVVSSTDLGRWLPTPSPLDLEDLEDFAAELNGVIVEHAPCVLSEVAGSSLWRRARSIVRRTIAESQTMPAGVKSETTGPFRVEYRDAVVDLSGSLRGPLSALCAAGAVSGRALPVGSFPPAPELDGLFVTRRGWR